MSVVEAAAYQDAVSSRKAAQARGREWEVKCERLFRVNKARWRWFHLPKLPTKQLNQRLPADLPDYWLIGRLGTDREGRLHLVECKTGGGEQTQGQSYLMRCLLAVPGVTGGVYYPYQYAELVRIVGDDVVG